MTVCLQGKKILITRQQDQAKPFSEKVKQYGGVPIEVPLLKISCKPEVDLQILERLQEYEWIFFTSANGVRCFFNVCKKHDVDFKSMKETQFAVVGHKTESELKKYEFAADFIPSVYNAEVMAREFLSYYSADGPLLIARGNRSRDILPDTFLNKRIAFDAIEVYETVYNAKMQGMLNRLLMENSLDFLTFASPSAVDAFIKLAIGNPKLDMIKAKNCACIGTTTAKKAKEYGFSNRIIPNEFTIEGMLEKISESLW